ncbi:MAG: hypothetical protein JWO36_2318 [Myxococcales bacterium]|nr:hypothetical protein [Myxococcales bacterium]
MKATTFAMAPVMVQKLLDSVIYEAVVETIDFDALHRLEEMLISSILEVGEIETDTAIAVANTMIERALHQLAADPRRYVNPQSGTGMDCELCAAAESHGS